MAARAGDFDVVGLWDAVDAQLRERGMTWPELNRELRWVSPATMARMRVTDYTSCQGVLPFIQWLGRTPESFTDVPPGSPAELLPDPGPDRWRWYWDTRELGASVESKRRELGLTWKQVAEQLGCTVAQAAGLKRPGRNRPGYGGQGITYHKIGVAMRAARWVGRSAASFMWEIPPQAQRAPRRATRRAGS